jgi:hypothetical protein
VTKITALTQATVAETTEAALLPIVIDPSGAPTTRKTSLERLGLVPGSWLDLARTHEADGAASGGNYTVGTEFCALRSGQVCTGMRFRWGGAIARTIKCALWKKGAGVQKTIDVAVTAAGLYTATWSGSQAITTNETWIVSIWEKSGTEFMPQSAAITRIPARPLRLRDYLIVNPSVYYSLGGDGEPDITGSTSTGFLCWAEPIVTG